MSNKILAINPGSTSTKIAVYVDELKVLSLNIEHDVEEIGKYDSVQSQFGMRKDAITKVLKEESIAINDFNAIVGRGGILPPVKAGAYMVNDEMIERLTNNPIVEHASNLGAIIAYEIAKSIGVNAYIYDSVAVDELIDEAKLSGLKGQERSCLSHVLNSRATAIKYAKSQDKEYKDMNLIVAHLGGGISMSAHCGGKMVDIVSDDEGPFSPERSGRVQLNKIIDMCFSGDYSKKEMKKFVRGKGGLVSHLQTVDVRDVEARVDNGDDYAKRVYNAMAYQISKGIGELSTVLEGKVDAIIMTGGIAYSERLTSLIKKRVQFIGEVCILPGENELESLALGTLRVLRGEEEARTYVENYAVSNN